MTVFLQRKLFAELLGADVAGLLVGFGLGVYFLPTIKAYQDKERNKEAILAVDLFLGCTLVG
jgi:hypothetical protein